MSTTMKPHVRSAVGVVGTVALVAAVLLGGRLVGQQLGGTRTAPAAGPAAGPVAVNLTPNGLAVDGGNVYVSDAANHVVLRLGPAGSSSVVAGIPGKVGAPTAGPATKSMLGNPAGLAVDASGNLFIADPANSVIEKVATATGQLSVLAGAAGTPGAVLSGPVGGTRLSLPEGLATDGSDLYLAATLNMVVAKISSATMSVVAGYLDTAGAPSCTQNLAGSLSCPAAPANHSSLAFPQGVAVDSAHNVYVADTGNHVVDKIDATTGTLSILAGVPTRFGLPGSGTASQQVLNGPTALAVHGTDLYIADGVNNVVVRVDLAADPPQLSIVAGDGANGTGGPPTPGPADQSLLHHPSAIAVDSAGNLFIGDTDNNVVEKVDAATGLLSILAGTGSGAACPFTSPLTTTVKKDITVPAYASCTIGSGGAVMGNVSVIGSLTLAAGGAIQGKVSVTATSPAIPAAFHSTGGTIKGDVDSTGALVLGPGTTVSGHVRSTGGSLDVRGTTVGADLQANGAAWVVLTGGTAVHGPVTLQGTTSEPDASVTVDGCIDDGTMGDIIGNVILGGDLHVTKNGLGAAFDVADCAGDVMVGGNLEVQQNAAEQVIGGRAAMRVQHDVRVEKNTGGGTLAATAAGGTCQLRNDTPAFIAVTNNTAAAGHNQCLAAG